MQKNIQRTESCQPLNEEYFLIQKHVQPLEQYARICYKFAVKLVPEMRAWLLSPLLSSSTKHALFDDKLPRLIRDHHIRYREHFYSHLDELKKDMFTVAINTLDCD